MSTQHTPGPWAIGECHESLATIYSEANKEIVFECKPASARRPLEFEHDIDFMVWACNCHDNLLAACERMFIAFEVGEELSEPWKGSLLQRDARAAIAKAKGETQ